MCIHPTPLNERELVLLCDCVDELPADMRGVAMECGNIKKVLTTLPTQLKKLNQAMTGENTTEIAQNQREQAWILHLLNELSPGRMMSTTNSSSSAMASGFTFIPASMQEECLKCCHHLLKHQQDRCLASQTRSLLSEYTWTEEEKVLIAEAVRYVMCEGEKMRLQWILEFLPAVRLQPTVMLSISRM